MYANDPYWIDLIARRAAEEKRDVKVPVETRRVYEMKIRVEVDVTRTV